MKLLIVAGPYEADRIRRAAVSAGIEAVAVEPGESLSGWITATRPEVIVVAPQVINPDPAVALAKIRAVPRGRVPVLLVGEAADEPAFRPLGDGFFVRPIAADDLIAQARAAMGAVPRALDDAGSGPQRSDGDRGSGPLATPPGSGATGRLALRPLVADRESGPLLVAGPDEGATPAVPLDESSRSRSRRVPLALERLAETIDADMEADLAAELRDVVRAVDARAAEKSGRVESARIQASTDATDAAASEPADEALAELTDESSQKTREVPQVGRPAADELPLNLPSLLARMYLSRLSGRLTLRAGAVRKHIVFDEGHPVLAGSTQAEDRLGAMLARQGRLTAAQASSLGDEAALNGRRLGMLLVERGLLPASDLTNVVRRHYEEIVHSLFSWERAAWTLATDGSLALEEGQGMETIHLSQHPSALILTGVRRDYGAPRALVDLGGPDVVLQLRPSAGLGDLLEKMELDEQERHAVLLFDGWRSLAAVGQAADLSLDTLATLAWTLTLLERLEPALLIETASGASPRPTTDRDESIDRALVQARHALVMDGDYFQVLGVSREAGGDEIRRAHDALLAGVNATVLHPAVVAELQAELDEIRVVLDEACGLLEDDRVRQQYRDHLPSPAYAAYTTDAPP